MGLEFFKDLKKQHIYKQYMVEPFKMMDTMVQVRHSRALKFNQTTFPLKSFSKEEIQLKKLIFKPSSIDLKISDAFNRESKIGFKNRSPPKVSTE